MTSTFLTWREVASIFKCGRSKAFGIMHTVGVIYAGRTPLVSSDAIAEHLRTHGEIRVLWSYSRGKHHVSI